MNKIWFIYDKAFEKNKKVPMFMIDTAKSKNINCCLKFEHYFKFINGYLTYKNKIIKRMPKVCFYRATNLDIAKHLESKGVKLVNTPFAIHNARYKFDTYKLLQKHNILQPKSFLYTNQSYTSIKENLNTPFIMKDNCGRKGFGVYLIKTNAEFNDALNKLPDIKNIIIQEYIEKSTGKDLRFYIINNKIYGSIIRYNENDFRSNIAQGGKVKQYFASKDEEALALKIAKILKLECGSVDFLFNEKKLVFCEANTSADFKQFLDLGVYLNEHIINYLKDFI